MTHYLPFDFVPQNKASLLGILQNGAHFTHHVVTPWKFKGNLKISSLFWLTPGNSSQSTSHVWICKCQKKVFLSLLYTLSCDPHTTISYARRGMHGSYNIPLLPYSIQHSTYKLHDGAGGYVYGTNTFPVRY